MVKLDLKDAYLTVGVHPESQKYLRFVWQGQTYQFLALPFGLNTARRIFTKLLKTACGSLCSHSNYQTSRLPGRHSNHRVVSANTKGAHIPGDRSSAKPKQNQWTPDCN